MGFFDKAKRLLGLGASDDERDTASIENEGASPRAIDSRATRLEKARGRKDRPPLKDVAPSDGQTVEDALAAREAGDARGARQILATIDRGAGLRTVLRAAAALEAGDEDELRTLLPAVEGEALGYKRWLQTAAALDSNHGDLAAACMDRAAAKDAPAWALAWTRALSSNAPARREGLVELLFEDAPLARTVAARDLGVEGAAADADAGARYAAFAHGRESIQRFGAPIVAELLQRATRSDRGRS